MHALALQGVQIGGQGRHQRFALTGAHFGDVALVQNDAADDLHRKVLHPQHPPGRLPADGKRLGQNVVQGLPRRQPLLQHPGLIPQGLLVHGGIGLLQRQHPVAQGADALDLLLAEIAE